MILNTGSRTDIPAYYSDWFYERVRAGEVLVRNPYYPTQITRYRLDPAVVDALVFCTKNPLPMLERLPLLDAFTMFWFVTITPYGILQIVGERGKRTCQLPLRSRLFK